MDYVVCAFGQDANVKSRVYDLAYMNECDGDESSPCTPVQAPAHSQLCAQRLGAIWSSIGSCVSSSRVTELFQQAHIYDEASKETIGGFSSPIGQ